MKQIKGEKYIYLLMGYILAKQQCNYASIGEDSRMVGGQNYWRAFAIRNYKNNILLIETKTSKGLANYTRVFRVVDNGGKKPTITEFVENNENQSINWLH